MEPAVGRWHDLSLAARRRRNRGRNELTAIGRGGHCDGLCTPRATAARAADCALRDDWIANEAPTGYRVKRTAGRMPPGGVASLAS